MKLAIAHALPLWGTGAAYLTYVVLSKKAFGNIRRPRLEQEGEEAAELKKALELGLLLVPVLCRFLPG